MAYDLIIRGGRVVDGSGLPSYVADIGVKNGKMTVPSGPGVGIRDVEGLLSGAKEV